MRGTFAYPLLFITLAIGLLPAQRAAWAVQTWNTTNGNWFTATNWTPTGVPNSSQTAAINNGGTATAEASGTINALQIDVGKNGRSGTLNTSNVNFVVEGSIDLGDVESTFAVGPVNVTSQGSATITDAASLLFGAAGSGDVNVAQTSAGVGAVAVGNADLNVQRIVEWQIFGDLDIGQTSGSGNATGTGTATISQITSNLLITGDLDVGQTSGAAGGNNAGTGNLNLTQAAEVEVGNDLDVGQSTGGGSSSGTGTVVLQDITALQIGDSLDVAKVRSFDSAANSALGTVTFDDLDADIGFQAANPGSIEIARVLTSEAASGTATGTLVLDQADVLVANDVIVGELALGGTNPASMADATLQLIRSRLDTRDLSVAVRLDGTAGSLQGKVEMDRSLLIVQSLMNLGPTSTLTMTIDGTFRAMGDGLDGEYAAVDADNAALDGALVVETSANYDGPVGRGAVDSFELIRSLFGISGAFDEITYNGEAVNNLPSYVGATPLGDDGLFVSITQNGTQVAMDVYFALVGDANGDRVVDGDDYAIWKAHKFSSSTNWSSADFNGDGVTDGADLLLWNSMKFTSVDGQVVPEPAVAGWLLLLVWGCAGRRASSTK